MPSRLLTTLLLHDTVAKYSEDQPRDEHGRWTGTGGAGTPAQARPPLAVHLQGLAVAEAGRLEALAGMRARAEGVAPSLPPDTLEGRKPIAAKPQQLSFQGADFEELHHPVLSGTPGERTASEGHLLTSRVTSDERMDGGINETHFMAFEDGTQAVFKPQDGASKSMLYFNIRPGQDMEREAGAWEVAKIVGMQDMVPATVIRTVDGRVGSMQDFVPNATEAMSSERPFDGAEDAARAAVFDAVIGNQDRHQGNWLVNEDTGKIALIDHGLSFPEGPYNSNVDGFMARASPEGGYYGYPELKGSPAQYVKPYVEHKSEILNTLTGLNLPKRAVQGVGDRIDLLATLGQPKQWENLQRGDLTPWLR
jgi:Phosphatidylinositol 3- and 4-kinase